MSATAIVIVLISSATTLITLLVYERVVRDLRYQVHIAEEHARACQHLVATMTRHPAGKQMGPANLRLITSQDAS